LLEGLALRRRYRWHFSDFAYWGKSFERIRYSYEGNTADLHYFLQDFPQLLGRIVLELKPEWRGRQRPYRPLAPSAPH
jgi:hypothetical protein